MLSSLEYPYELTWVSLGARRNRQRIQQEPVFCHVAPTAPDPAHRGDHGN